MAVQLIDSTFLNAIAPKDTLNDLLEYGDVIMMALFERSSMKLHSCNRYFSKYFRVSASEKNEIVLDHLVHDNSDKVKPILSYHGEKPIANIFYRHNDKSPIECYFYEYDNGTSLLMYSQSQLSSDLDLVEKMSAVTTEMAGITLELRKKNHELQITRDALAYQSRMAATSDIIQMLAHQWRQPLAAMSAIVGTMQLDNMMGSLTQTETTDKLEKMDEIAQQLSSMINEFRVLYDENTQFKQIELSKLINKATNLLQALFDDTGAVIHIDCISSIVCYTLEAELLQCIVGILKNSLEAFKNKLSTPAMIHIIVKEEKENILIIIDDNAGGIKNQDLSHVFEPYFSTKANTGKGLGLYVIKTMITEKMHGQINLINTQEGLKVTLVLPKAF